MPLPGDTPFVVFGDDWGRYPSTFQHVFRHVAPRFPVVWVNGIGHRVPTLNARDVRRAWEKLSRLSQSGSPVSPQPHRSMGGGVPAAIIEPRVLPWHNVGAVEQLNTWSLVRAIRQQLQRLGLTRQPVLVTGSPPSVGVLGRLQEALSVYYILDDFLNFPTYTATMLAPLERRMLERVDLVLATAASLLQTKPARSGRSRQLPQGVNYAHFAEPRPEPADLAGIPRPRIGFAGSVSTQCDLGLLAQLAEAFPEASLVLVGPVAFAPEQLAALRLPNVHLLGVRPYDDLPAYVQHFDVGIIPYVQSAWTVAVDPLKLLEYLAAGIPVVTTAIPEVRKYADWVAVCEDNAAFVEAVRGALAAGPKAHRERGQALARQHTWERRADTLLEIIDGAIQEKGAVRSAASQGQGTRPHTGLSASGAQGA